jgi:hypothetical protein
MRLGIVPLILCSLVACGDAAGEPITDNSDPDLGEDTPGDDPQSCAAPERPLACTATRECANYPDTVCEQGFCVCPSSDPGMQDDDAGKPSCVAPEQPLACTATQGCSNYPGTLCEQGFCACPSADAGTEIDDPTDPDPSCVAPERPLPCTATRECANYPDTVCGDGFCVCP